MGHYLEMARMVQRQRRKRMTAECKGEISELSETSITLQQGPEWLREAFEVARDRIYKCFMCKLLVLSARKNQWILHDTYYDHSGKSLFPVSAQIEHLRIEYSIYRGENK